MSLCLQAHDAFVSHICLLYMQLLSRACEIVGLSCLQYFARTVPAATQLIEVFCALCYRYGWQKFAIVFTDVTTEDADAFESRLLAARIEVGVRVKVSYRANASIALQQIKQKPFRIVLLMAETHLTIRRWMLDAYDLGMTGKGWAYVMQGAASVESITASAGTYMAGDGRDGDALLAVQGLVSMVPRPQFSAKFQSLMQRAAMWDARERPGRAVAAHMWQGAEAPYLGFMYDALYALVGAADAQMRTGGRVSNGTALMERLCGGGAVEGVTGQVIFDANGDNMVPWAGLNVRNRTMVPVLLYKPLLKLLTTAAESSELQQIVWPGATTNTPSDDSEGALSKACMALAFRPCFDLLL